MKRCKSKTSGCYKCWLYGVDDYHCWFCGSYDGADKQTNFFKAVIEIIRIKIWIAENKCRCGKPGIRKFGHLCSVCGGYIPKDHKFVCSSCGNKVNTRKSGNPETGKCDECILKSCERR